MASVQFQVSTEEPPHAGAGPNDPVHVGRVRHVVVAVAMAVVPPRPGAVMVHVSPAEPIASVVEPVHGTIPLDGVEPVHV